MNSGTNITYTNAFSIKVNDYLVINKRPCKIVNVKHSKTGKHGGCKCHFVGIDIFTSRKYETIHMSTDNVEIPIVTKKDYQLCDINREEQDNGNELFFCSLNYNGNLREDLVIPKGDLESQIMVAFAYGSDIEVTVMTAMGEEKIIGFKIIK